jgi:hypothetical protein
MTIATISDIKEGFVNKASAFKVDKQYPSKTELQETFRMMEENAMTVACFENECDEFGFAVLLCKESEWKQYHANKQTEENRIAAIAAEEQIHTEVLATGPTIPAIPTFPNPGRFILNDAWTDKERGINKILHEQSADAYLLASNIDKALVMAFKEIFNESIWADLNKGTTIGSSSLRNRHSVRQIRNHLELKFNKHRPVDIQTVMDKFVMDVNTAQPLEKYFERQQQCQLLLVETSEPIRDASMKRTAIGHFLKIPHLVRCVREYESDVDPLGTSPWEDLRSYFIEKQMEHIDDQATLSTAGIANSAEVDDELHGIKYEMANMAEKAQQFEEALVTMAAFMAEAKQPAPAPAPTPPAPLSMEQQFAAFVAAQQQKEAPKEQSAIDTAVAKALGQLSTKGSGSGGGGGGGPGGTGGARRTRKPSKRCTFYCHSHGCNFSHNSPECKDKKTGHIDAATYSTPSNGKMWNKDIYTGPGCLPCNTE